MTIAGYHLSDPLQLHLGWSMLWQGLRAVLLRFQLFLFVFVTADLRSDQIRSEHIDVLAESSILSRTGDDMIPYRSDSANVASDLSILNVWPPCKTRECF